MNTTTNNPETATLKQVVHRAKMSVLGHNTVMMPKTAKITHAQMAKVKGGMGIEIYFLKTIPCEDDVRTFIVVPTGEEVPHGGLAEFIQTVAFPGMPAVHIFELV